MEGQADEQQLVSVPDPDPNSEARIVVATKQVSRSECAEGVRFGFHVTSIYSLRGLWHVARYLNDEQNIPYAALFSRFLAFCNNRQGSQYMIYVERTINTGSYYKFAALGGIVHTILHSARDDFDALLEDFVCHEGAASDPTLALCFDLDLLCRPYVYSNTPLALPNRLKCLGATIKRPYEVAVHVPSHLADDVAAILQCPLNVRTWVINYRAAQIPFMRGKAIEGNYAYCQDRLHMLKSILPTWSYA
jgi:hypothetical protein